MTNFMKARNINFNRLNDLMDTAIRDAEIKTMWIVLSDYTDRKKRDIIQLIAKDYKISDKSVEAIVYDD